MPFDINSAVALENEKGSSIPTTSFDIFSAQEINQNPARKPSPISSFLRNIFKNSPLEEIDTLKYELKNKDRLPQPGKDESYRDFQKRWNEFLKPREEEIANEGVLRQVEVPMTAAIAATGAAAPLSTSAMVGGFSVADHFFNARRWIEEQAPETAPVLKDVAEILDFVAKGALLGGGLEFSKKFTMDRIEKLNLPKAALIESDKVEAIKKNDVVTETLGITPEHIEASVNSGIPLKVPIENLVDLATKPEFGKIKEELNLSENANATSFVSEKGDLLSKKSENPQKEESQNSLFQQEIPGKNLSQENDNILQQRHAGQEGLLEEQSQMSKSKPEALLNEQKASDISILTEKNSLSPLEQSTSTKQSQTALGEGISLRDNITPGSPIVKEGGIDPVQRVIEALKAAKPVRGKQEKLYTKERGARMAKAIAVGEKVKGEKGFYAELGQLKGELPKAEFEAIRDKLKQEDIDSLFNMVTDAPTLSFWEKVTARTALGKLFGEFGGKVPQKGELALLNKVFGNKFVETLIDKMSFSDKAKEAVGQILNIPRSIMSSFDLSAPLRQGVFLIGRKEFGPAFKEMFGYFAKEKNFKALQEQIARRPNFDLMKESGLALTDMDAMLDTREEAFMSNLAEKIPIVGQGIKASGRAYVGFLNKLRADVFDDMVKKATDLGLDPKENRDLLKDIANFVNTATGRGDLGSLGGSTVALNNIFFSPRLIMSRINLLRPDYYIRLNPFVRKEALKSLLTFSGTVGTILALSKLSGADVGTDWRSSDFAKIKINNTRIDILGGFQQYLRMVGQLVSGQYVSSTTGRVVTLGEGYRPLTRMEIISRQVKSKLAPVSSLIVNILEGQTWDGKKINLTDEVKNRLTPMVLESLVEIAKEDPELFPVGLMGIFGVGVQTYKQKKSSKF